MVTSVLEEKALTLNMLFYSFQSFPPRVSLLLMVNDRTWQKTVPFCLSQSLSHLIPSMLSPPSPPASTHPPAHTHEHIYWNETIDVLFSRHGLLPMLFFSIYLQLHPTLPPLPRSRGHCCVVISARLSVSSGLGGVQHASSPSVCQSREFLECVSASRPCDWWNSGGLGTTCLLYCHACIVIPLFMTGSWIPVIVVSDLFGGGYGQPVACVSSGLINRSFRELGNCCGHSLVDDLSRSLQ